MYYFFAVCSTDFLENLGAKSRSERSSTTGRVEVALLGKIMPEEIFKNFPEKEISPETEILTQKPKSSIKKFLLPLIVLIVLVLIAGASFYFYSKIKPDPISLLPKETTFYLKIKINPEDQQVKNLKELLNRFPYYEKISQKIGEEFRKWKEETPALKILILQSPMN